MLGFMTTPVLPPEVVPPSFARTMLRLRNPPMLDTIAAHLTALVRPSAHSVKRTPCIISNYL
jgi:hypothetical protein